MSTTTQPVAADPRLRLARTARLLAWATIGWNTVEAIVAVGAGVAASSSALLGFGLDSAIEVSSATVVLWQLRTDVPEHRERQALRLIALSFFLLAGWVAITSLADLLRRAEPGESSIGIVLAATSLIVMPALAMAKRRVGQKMGSATVIADSAQTWLCTSLSAVLLIGLAANASLGWWWADPVAGIVIAIVATREGREAWRGEGCCAPVATRPSNCCPPD